LQNTENSLEDDSRAMGWKTFGLVALVAAIGARPAIAQSPDCAFNIVQSAPRPELSGSDDITSRSYVITESESPVAILRIDLSEVVRDDDRDGLHSIGGVVQAEIQNISDQTIDEIWIQVCHRLAASRTGWGCGGHATLSALAPGERLAYNGLSPTEAVKLEARYQTLVSVESARFGACVYRPKSPCHSPEWRLLP
jgi:hypothetical protein